MGKAMGSSIDEPVNNFETNAGSFQSRSDHRAGCGDLKKRVMDIEDVLSWAYRDELPKEREGRGGGSGAWPSVSPMFSSCAFGTRIDHWSHEPGFPSAVGTPDPDALAVEAAVAGLERFANQLVDDELHLVPDFAALGVDEVQAVRRALPMMQGIVTRCAKLRQRPFWHSKTYPTALTQHNGRPTVVRWEPTFSKSITGQDVEHEMLVPVEVRQKGVYPFGSYCPLKYDPDPQSIADERAEYLVWWGALDALALALSGKLRGIAVLPPAAAQRPWIENRDLGKPPRVFEDLTARVYRREQKTTAAAHRALGLRRSSGARSRSDRTSAPTRPRSSGDSMPGAKTACGVV